jgi:hypothetical protein
MGSGEKYHPVEGQPDARAKLDAALRKHERNAWATRGSSQRALRESRAAVLDAVEALCVEGIKARVSYRGPIVTDAMIARRLVRGKDGDDG